jgi:hypothetical protein
MYQIGVIVSESSYQDNFCMGPTEELPMEYVTLLMFVMEKKVRVFVRSERLSCHKRVGSREYVWLVS